MMIDQYDLVTRLTDPSLPVEGRSRLLSEFAHEFGWRPSDAFFTPELNEFTNAHLLVEHGLEISAVLTFLRSPWRFADLGSTEQRRLSSISYNNLVDWHIHVEPDEVSFVFNRTERPKVVATTRISRSSYDDLRSEAFEKITGKRPSSNLPALDDALIRTISLWKRQLSAELGYDVPNEALSALFNAIFFTRAVEDQAKRALANGSQRAQGEGGRALLDAWRSNASSLRAVLGETVVRLVPGKIPDYLLDAERLQEFDNLDPRTSFALLSDFYRNRFASYYEYDFSIISKHALSRIYESYASVLRLEDYAQASLFPELPEVERDRAFGSVYTPQYIARFFARFLKEDATPAVFQRLRSCDPACGSGIFLRTLLEMQTEPLVEELDASSVDQIFEAVVGSDVDRNAAQAARLSLALLYLVLRNRLPQNLNIVSKEAIGYYAEHPELHGSFDAVIANPPFVSLDLQSEEMRQRIAQFMGDDASGRIDMYLPFLKIALDLLKPGGHGLFVLPHSFLLKKSASGIRKLLSSQADIRVLADLSSVRVFGDVGSYVLLLVFQKRSSTALPGPPAKVVRCQDFPGQALEDTVEGREAQNSFYSIYQVGQDTFARKDWIVAPPQELALRRKLEAHPPLDKFLWVRQGVVTGADPVFIVSEAQVPQGESEIFLPFLPDRDMELYRVPDRADQYLFYPFVGHEKLSEERLRQEFPQTWSYLERHRTSLEARGSLKRYNRQWWEPMWPRAPENIVRPKLISPHLVLVPRFSFDRDGRFAVSHSPFLYPRAAGAEDDLLLYFLGVLNSSLFHRYMAAQSHTYRGGYLMLEPKTLKGIPVPDPSRLGHGATKELLDAVEARLEAHGPDALRLEHHIDNLVTSLYGLSSSDVAALTEGG